MQATMVFGWIYTSKVVKGLSSFHKNKIDVNKQQQFKCINIL